MKLFPKEKLQNRKSCKDFLTKYLQSLYNCINQYSILNTLVLL